MKKLFTTKILFIFTLFFSVQAFAHGPTPQRVDEQIEINANASQVWAVISSFNKIVEWHPAVKSLKMENDTTRVITFENDQSVTESLDYSTESDHSVGYRLLNENFEAIPVSFYTIALEAKEDGDKTVLTWSGRFYRADTGNFPPAHLSDEAAVSAMTEFAQAGLEGIKNAVEHQGK